MKKLLIILLFSSCYKDNHSQPHLCECIIVDSVYVGTASLFVIDGNDFAKCKSHDTTGVKCKFY